MNKISIILFDGDCAFCSFWVNYVLKRDKKDSFRFASLTSETGKRLIKEHQLNTTIDTVLLIEKNDYQIKSTAVLIILKQLGGFWRIIYFLIIIPCFIRDYFYDLVAKNRLKLVHKKCSIDMDNKLKNKILM